jgi:HTH-type transcriptional regulator/antitoxin HigA
MKLELIETIEEYEDYLNRVNDFFDKNVKLNSSAGEELQLALTLIQQYEDVHFPIAMPDQ